MIIPSAVDPAPLPTVRVLKLDLTSKLSMLHGIFSIWGYPGLLLGTGIPQRYCGLGSRPPQEGEYHSKGSHQIFCFSVHIKVMVIPYCSLVSVHSIVKKCTYLKNTLLLKCWQLSEPLENVHLFAGGASCLGVDGCSLISRVVAEGLGGYANFLK